MGQPAWTRPEPSPSSGLEDYWPQGSGRGLAVLGSVGGGPDVGTREVAAATRPSPVPWTLPLSAEGQPVVLVPGPAISAHLDTGSRLHQAPPPRPGCLTHDPAVPAAGLAARLPLRQVPWGWSDHTHRRGWGPCAHQQAALGFVVRPVKRPLVSGRDEIVLLLSGFPRSMCFQTYLLQPQHADPGWGCRGLRTSPGRRPQLASWVAVGQRGQQRVAGAGSGRGPASGTGGALMG